MKIVHVEDFIHPEAGYQVNLLSRLQQLDGHQVTIVTAELEKIPSFLTSFFGKEDIHKHKFSIVVHPLAFTELEEFVLDFIEFECARISKGCEEIFYSLSLKCWTDVFLINLNFIFNINNNDK